MEIHENEKEKGSGKMSKEKRKERESRKSWYTVGIVVRVHSENPRMDDEIKKKVESIPDVDTVFVTSHPGKIMLLKEGHTDMIDTAEVMKVRP